jgi:hypothetical protein
LLDLVARLLARRWLRLNADQTEPACQSEDSRGDTNRVI